MTWVRKDDRMPWHRKVAPLSDAAYRLLDEAICWSSSNLTDGRIRADELAAISKRGRKKFADELVNRNLWHAADSEACASENCPPCGPDGWVIHDYWDYQPSRADVLADRERKAAAGRLGGVRSGRTRRARKEAETKQPASPERSRNEADASPERSRTRSRNEAQGVPSRPVPPPSQREGGTGAAPALTRGRSAPPANHHPPPVRPNGHPPDLTDLRRQIADAAAGYRNADRRPPALPSTPATPTAGDPT